jgi:very-short-patch-repair endonuclease
MFMGLHALIPAVLTGGPFTLEVARQAGLTWKQLQGPRWRRISYGRYLWAGLGERSDLVLSSVRQRLPAGAAFSGRTAAWLHGLDVGPLDSIEVTIPKGSGSWALVGVTVSQASLSECDVVVRRGLPTTSPGRTVFDLGCRPPLVEAVVAVDMALHARVVVLAEIDQIATTRSGSRGIRQFRQALDFAEPATESPMETRMRMLLVLNGIPKPEVQVSLRDDSGRFLGRADLYYPAQRLVLEYDGGTHRNSLVEDNRRQNLLVNAGFRILRFTFADVTGTPDAVVSQVRAALRR